MSEHRGAGVEADKISPRKRHGQPSGQLLQEGRNCWRLVHTDRLAYLIDGQAYFSALKFAIDRAEHSVFMLGWDFSSKTKLDPTEKEDGSDGAISSRDGGVAELSSVATIESGRDRDGGSNGSKDGSCDPTELAAYLARLLDRRPGLRIRMLGWDFSMIYAGERELLSLIGGSWSTHRRLHFKLDHKHPLGAAHHQKVVVVDDSIAFLGGLDLTTNRWDTPEHLAKDARRRNPDGAIYGPFHDVQVAVDGEAAAALGELARQRWRNRTGKSLVAAPRRRDLWPPDLEPDLTDARVGISRTIPRWRSWNEAREVETAMLDMVRAARRWIYIETQYFTAAMLGDALAERLAEEDGPEVVLVNPLKCPGWLEENTMGVLRARLLRKLRAADHGGRLGVFYPAAPGLEDGVFVHSKLLVVDESFACVGSANLSNRSFGLDTECNLALEAAGDERTEQAIGSLRDRLVAEHLGVSENQFRETLRSTDSLLAAIRAFQSGARSLQPMDGEVSELADRLITEGSVVDPEKPMNATRLVSTWLYEASREPARSWLLGGGALLGLAGLVYAARRFAK